MADCKLTKTQRCENTPPNKRLQRRPRRALRVVTCEIVRGPAERGSLDPSAANGGEYSAGH